MTISKNFVQAYKAQDCEGRYFNWEDTTRDYDEILEELKKEYKFYIKGVRLVEKTFDSETFKIEVKVIKEAVF